jgi:hypothetical protein
MGGAAKMTCLRSSTGGNPYQICDSAPAWLNNKRQAEPIARFFELIDIWTVDKPRNQWIGCNERKRHVSFL